MKESLGDLAVLCVSAWECRESDPRQPDQSPGHEEEQRNGKRGKRECVCVCVSVCEKGNPCLFVWGFSSKGTAATP